MTDEEGDRWAILFRPRQAPHKVNAMVLAPRETIRRAIEIIASARDHGTPVAIVRNRDLVAVLAALQGETDGAQTTDPHSPPQHFGAGPGAARQGQARASDAGGPRRIHRRKLPAASV